MSRKSEATKHSFSGDRKLELVYKLVIDIGREVLNINIDYSPIHHPYAHVVISPINTELVGENIVEMTINIEKISRGNIDIDKPIINFRIVCDHGWIYYGYAIARSTTGITYTEKTWLHILYEGLRYERIDLDEDLRNKLENIIARVTELVLEVMEEEGII